MRLQVHLGSPFDSEFHFHLIDLLKQIFMHTHTITLPLSARFQLKAILK